MEIVKHIRLLKSYDNDLYYQQSIPCAKFYDQGFLISRSDQTLKLIKLIFHQFF